MTRRYANGAEEAFRKWAEEEQGWEVSKRGWPDFIVFADPDKEDPDPRDVLVVEVKPHGGRPLKKSQTKVLRVLAKAGLNVYRWSPDEGLRRIK